MDPVATATDAEVREAARGRYADEGHNVEIDDGAPISRMDGGAGAYVQAWVWVDFRQAEEASHG